MTRIIDGDELPEGDCWCYEVLIEKDKAEHGVISFHTHWVGYADPEQRIELREPSVLSRNGLLARKSRYTGEPIEFIDDPLELARLWIAGGHAAIDYDLAQAEIAKHLGPAPATSSRGSGPFDALTVPMEVATVRAPSKKLRMTILKRDEYRCRVCGQRPADDANVTLHVHHIRPWAKHGATVPSNLITICHTCHAGLDPHYEVRLADLIETPRRTAK